MRGIWMVMLYVQYQIVITFFDYHSEVEQGSDIVNSFSEVDRYLKDIKHDYIFSYNPQSWAEDCIFSTQIKMSVNNELYFDKIINIIQLRCLNRWKNLELLKHDSSNDSYISKIQCKLEKSFCCAGEITLDEFLTYKLEYFDYIMN